MITAEEARNLKHAKRIEIIAEVLNKINDKIIEAAIITNTVRIDLTEKELIYKDDIIKELKLNGFTANFVQTIEFVKKFNTIELEW
jgi:5,10-methenyltetrahydromethanopterin hydrogenase